MLRWVPVTGVAVAVLAGVMVLQPEPTTIDPLPASVDDMEILLGEESMILGDLLHAVLAN